MLHRWFHRNDLRPLDLKGCAETANGVEKYGSLMAYAMVEMLTLQDARPRQNARIVNIGGY